MFNEKGSSRINIELAIKLGSIFHVKPTLWLHAQSKNDLLEMEKNWRMVFKGYSLEECLEMEDYVLL